MHRKAYLRLWIAASLGLIAMAAMFGAASASAAHSVFCKENVSTCSESSQYPGELWLTSTLEGPGVYGEIEFPGFMTITCTQGKIAGLAKTQVEGPMTGEATTFWFAKCSPEGCAVNSGLSVAAPWKLEATGGGDGTITASSLTLPVSCSKYPYNFNCKYKAGSMNAQFEGGPGGEAFLKGEETPLSFVEGSFACLSFPNANLRFRMVVREPTSLGYGTYLTN